MAGAKKRKASKKKNKKGETLDSNNQPHHGNDSSTHSLGSVDEAKLEERDSDGGELEREEEEEEILDQREVDGANGEGLEEQVVEIATEEKSLENGSGSADFSSVNVAEEIPVVVPASEDSVAENFDLEDKEVAVLEEAEKLVIAEYEELKEENTTSSALDDNKGIVDFVEEEAVVESNESVEPQIMDDDEEDLVKEGVKVTPEEVVSAVDESFVIPVPPVVVDSELTKNEDSSFSQISDQKDEFSSVAEAEKSEQIENPVTVVPLDDEEKLSEAPAVSNGVENGGKPLETDNQVAAVVINTSCEVDNGKELEIQNKPSEDQPLINPLPIRKTSWTGCCGLFEVFSSANR